MKTKKFYTELHSLNFVDEVTLNNVCPIESLFMCDTSRRAYSVIPADHVLLQSATLEMHNVRTIPVHAPLTDVCDWMDELILKAQAKHEEQQLAARIDWARLQGC